jgi:hypothetical protein
MRPGYRGRIGSKSSAAAKSERHSSAARGWRIRCPCRMSWGCVRVGSATSNDTSWLSPSSRRVGPPFEKRWPALVPRFPPPGPAAPALRLTVLCFQRLVFLALAGLALGRRRRHGLLSPSSRRDGADLPGGTTMRPPGPSPLNCPLVPFAFPYFFSSARCSSPLRASPSVVAGATAC